MSKNKELMSSAIHESAHMLKAFCDGAVLRKVEISATGNSVVHINHPVHKARSIDYNSPIFKDWVAFQLCGTVAELYFKCSISSKKPLDGSDSDIRVAFETTKKKGFIAPPHGYTEKDFFCDHCTPTKLFILSHWKYIQSLAELLIKKKKLSGYEVAKFLIKKGLKAENALPLHKHIKEET